MKLFCVSVYVCVHKGVQNVWQIVILNNCVCVQIYVRMCVCL